MTKRTKSLYFSQIGPKGGSLSSTEPTVLTPPHSRKLWVFHKALLTCRPTFLYHAKVPHLRLVFSLLYFSCILFFYKLDKLTYCCFVLKTYIFCMLNQREIILYICVFAARPCNADSVQLIKFPVKASQRNPTSTNRYLNYILKESHMKLPKFIYIFSEPITQKTS